MTGGLSQTLTAGGIPTPGKAVFFTPTHSRLAQRQVDFLSTPAKTTNVDPGVARGGMKVTFGDRTSTEGCCTVNAGSVIIDVGVRWSLNQPETLVDEAITELQALVFTPAFIAAVKQGILPT
jgi:hypothetical protein